MRVTRSGSVASGVTSRGEMPVPPVVKTKNYKEVGSTDVENETIVIPSLLNK